MASWRDSVSEGAQDDLDELLNATLPFAQQTLEKYGGLLPFGASVSESGELALAAGDPGLGEQPPSTAVLDTLRAGMQSRRDALRAVALVYDVKADDSEAICVDAEHREGIAIRVLMPYTKRRVRRRVEYGDLTASPGELQVWPT